MILRGFTGMMETQKERLYQEEKTGEMHITINTSGLVGKILVCILSFLMVLIVGCDSIYSGFQQEEEPNDSYETATEFQMSEGSWTGAVTTRDDKDYFKVYLAGEFTYRFRLTNLQNDLTLMLYNDSPEVVESSTNSELLDENISVDVAATDSYYLLVEVSSTLDTTDTYFGKYILYQSRE